MLIAPIELVKESLALYKKNWQRLWTYVLLMFAALVAFQLIGFLFLKFDGESGIPQIGGLQAVLFLILVVAVAVFNFWVGLAIIKTMADAYENKTILPVKKELEDVKSAIWPGFLASLLAGLAVFGGMILFIIPGVIFAIWFAFTTYAIVLDKHKTVESLKFSKSLVKGRWWAVLWRLLVPALIFVLAAVILQGIVTIPTGFLLESMPEGSIAFTLVSMFITLVMLLFGALITPIASAISTILYLELKRTRPPHGTSVV